MRELAEANSNVDIVITADTIVSRNDSEVIEKPENDDHAFQMIKSHFENGSH